MTDTGRVTYSREIIKRVADRLIDSHGPAAMAIAALSASRSAKVNVTEEARFWLGVCNEIRAVRSREAMVEADAAAVH
jgi:hypothetical protein